MNFKIPRYIALELVPRALPGVLDEAREALAAFPCISSVNIPEIRTVPIKSYEPAVLFLKNGIPVTPHFRMIDRSSSELLEKISALVELGLREVLFIGGDPDPSVRPSGLSTVEAVAIVKRRFPELSIYAGLDPYRQSFREELDYARRKLDAGCDGFYTQPFFSIGMLDQWLEQLPGVTVRCGIAPVMSAKSRLYWERTNKVVFPPRFAFDEKSQAALARAMLSHISEACQEAYLMPVRIGAKEYLGDVFEDKNATFQG